MRKSPKLQRRSSSSYLDDPLPSALFKALSPVAKELKNSVAVNSARFTSDSAKRLEDRWKVIVGVRNLFRTPPKPQLRGFYVPRKEPVQRMWRKTAVVLQETEQNTLIIITKPFPASLVQNLRQTGLRHKSSMSKTVHKSKFPHAPFRNNSSWYRGGTEARKIHGHFD